MRLTVRCRGGRDGGDWVRPRPHQTTWPRAPPPTSERTRLQCESGSDRPPRRRARPRRRHRTVSAFGRRWSPIRTRTGAGPGCGNSPMEVTKAGFHHLALRGRVAVRTPHSTADADRLLDEMALDVVAVGFQPRGHWAGIPGQPPTAAHSDDADGEHREVPIGVEVKT